MISPMGGRKLTEAQRAELTRQAVAAYTTMSIRKVAGILGISYGATWSILDAAGCIRSRANARALRARGYTE